MRKATPWSTSFYADVFPLLFSVLLLVLARYFLGWPPPGLDVWFALLFANQLFSSLYRQSHRRGRGWFRGFDEAFSRGWRRFHAESRRILLPSYCPKCHHSLDPEQLFCPQCGFGPFARPDGAEEGEAFTVWPWIPAGQLLDPLMTLPITVLPLAVPGMDAWLRVLLIIMMIVSLFNALHCLSYALGKGWFARYDERFSFGWAQCGSESQAKELEPTPCSRCGASIGREEIYCTRCGQKKDYSGSSGK
jgi:uncharacterized OB-fold protein